MTASEAARLLGLKYTTYCDMLHRAAARAGNGDGTPGGFLGSREAPEAAVIELLDDEGVTEIRFDLPDRTRDTPLMAAFRDAAGDLFRQAVDAARSE